MQLVSFDPLRVWNIPGVQHIKPEKWRERLEIIKAADWLLFPEYWQINFLVYGLKKRLFPSISSYTLGYSKAEMTYAFQATCPDNTPYTLVLPRTESAVDIILQEMPLPCVAKEIRNSMGMGVYLIQTAAQLRDYVARNEMLYVQEYLAIDRDLRVVVIGKEVLTAYWRIGQAGGFHNNVSRGGTTSFDGVPQEAVDLVGRVAAELNIDHAGFDVAVVDGRCYILEFNMRFGNQTLREAGVPVGRHIHAYLQRELNAAVSADRG